MKLYIRVREGWINFIHNVEELKMFEEAYIPGTQVLIGDLSTFNNYMMQRLLKLLEENPLIDCYSSQDIPDSILISRFMQVLKAPAESTNLDTDYFESDRSYEAVNTSLSLSNNLKLFAKEQSKFNINLLEAHHNRGRSY